MTVLYLGMKSHTGLSISEADYIRQSVRDILVTPVGSRVMRHEYGSLLSVLIDQAYAGEMAAHQRPETAKAKGEAQVKT